MKRSIAKITAIVVLLSASACESTGARPASDAVPEELANRIAAGENGLMPRGSTPLSSEPFSLQERMERYGVPGVSVAIIADGEIDWAKGYGVLRDGAAEIVDTTTLFQGASISKVVTTVAILRLLEQGRLTLDEDVNAYLSSWEVPESQHTRQSRVTLRGILTHSAGLTVSGFLGYEPEQSLPTLEEVLTGRSPANSPPVRVDFVPGTNQRYSGGGFTVALGLSPFGGRLSTSRAHAAARARRRSNSIGDRCPRAECRLRGLYQPSMKSKIFIFASAWLRKRSRSSSSHSRVAKNDSHIALS
jgi:CubicO group peptidase (beta-lactamase class C family)